MWNRELIICSQRARGSSARAVRGERQRPAHPLHYGVVIRSAEGPGLELQADGAGIVAPRQGGEERSQGKEALAGEAVLISAGQVGVGEMDVTELGSEGGVGASGPPCSPRRGSCRG